MALPLSSRPRARLRVAFGVVAFGCVVLTSGGASAAISWKRVGTVTTLTNGQLCTNDGTSVYCDSTTPTVAGGLMGIGSTLPVVSLDISQMTDALALPGGSNAQRPTGAALVNGEIRYNNTGTGQVEAYYNGAWNSLVTSATLGTSTPAAGSTGYVQFNNGGYLGASSSFFWDNTNGRLGIGITSPNALLQVNGTMNSTSIFSNVMQAWSVPSIPSVKNTNTAAIAVGSFETGISGRSRMDFMLAGTPAAGNNWGATPDTTVMTLNANGNVGIGTTLPNAKLSVGGAGDANTGISGYAKNSNNVAVEGIENAGVHAIYFRPNNSGYNLISSNYLSGSTYLPLSLSSRENNSDFVLKAGNVGIGTTSPAGTLDVEGGTASSGSGTNVKVYAQNGQASGNTNGGNIVLMPGTANGTGAAGAVGIGSASPATGMKADIAGPVKVAGTGSEPCTAAQVGAIRYNPSGNYFELCSYP